MFFVLQIKSRQFPFFKVGGGGDKSVESAEKMSESDLCRFFSSAFFNPLDLISKYESGFVFNRLCRKLLCFSFSKKTLATFKKGASAFLDDKTTLQSDKQELLCSGLTQVLTVTCFCPNKSV